MLDLQQIKDYLSRIGIVEDIPINLDGLNRLIRAQLAHVPFENIDVWATGACPSLATGDLFEKIVLHKRGGYCFELNTLFRILLNSLGFDAYQCIASLIHEDRIDPPAHNVIICCLDGKKYLIDVGFGGPVPFGAMDLKEGTFAGFRLWKEEDLWHLERIDGTKPAFCFRDIPAEIRELEPLNFYISQKPDSHFRHILRCSLRHADGTVHTLVDDTLQVRVDGSTQETTVADKPAVLEQHFGMQREYITLRK